MSLIPDDLAELVHRAASGTREYTADLGQVERRWRRRRRRRTVACLAGVAMLVAVSLAAVPVLSGRSGEPRPDGGHMIAGSRADQRLMIQGYDAVREVHPLSAGGSGRHFVASLMGVALEVGPEGTIKRWGTQSHVVPAQVVGLPDGRVAVLGIADYPDKSAVMLMVLNPTGAADLARSIGDGVPVRLVGATNQTAYLWRSAGLVAHDLDTGEERVAAPAARLGGALWSAGHGEADVSGDLVLTSGVDRDRCQLRTLDVRSGATARHRVTPGACHEALLARLSPDRRSAAVTYLPSPAGPLRLAVVDLATGATRFDQVIETPGDANGLGPAMPVGVAWLDHTRVRVAAAAAPDTKRVYRLDEVLHVRTYEVG